MRAKKRFGQHFLRDNNIINKIIQALNPKVGDCLIEIGPGLGALTQPLLQQTKSLQVVEIDRDVIPTLQQMGKETGELIIHEQDALQINLNLFSSTRHNIRLIGNLPYNISSPLLFHLLTYANLIDDMHFMLQKEVVDRICAKPGNKDYGRLSVMMQYACHVQWLFDVSPGCFAPPPKVMSAVLRLKPYHEKPVIAKDETFLSEIVRVAFSQRRKTLRNTLKEFMKEEDWQKVAIDPQQRAEQLTVAEFVNIANLLKE